MLSCVASTTRSLCHVRRGYLGMSYCLQQVIQIAVCPQLRSASNDDQDRLQVRAVVESPENSTLGRRWQRATPGCQGFAKAGPTATCQQLCAAAGTSLQSHTRTHPCNLGFGATVPGCRGDHGERMYCRKRGGHPPSPSRQGPLPALGLRWTGVAGHSGRVTDTGAVCGSGARHMLGFPRRAKSIR